MNSIAVGSANPVKIKATAEVAEKIWPEAKVISVDVPSGVSDQPTSDEEAIRGAINRAQRARKATDADLGIGLEGSICKLRWGMFLTGWSGVAQGGENLLIGGGGRLQLPEQIAERVRAGEELGKVMDELEDRKDIKKGIGAIGVLTGELVTRKEAYKTAVIFSLAKLLKPEYYPQSHNHQSDKG